MSLSGFDDVAAGWGAPIHESSGDLVRDAMVKEKIIREITAAQEDLQVLLERVRSVEKDVEKLGAGNATLQMYIDNLTMQMARRR
ncbi:hypothetical protein EWM64_g3799 [Hericium alpestre]|uniref:Uncharacterized protein n=1 Tax=Hericium alpestre TaxID=135208 RepID=A0A4Z0A164_9AGAM|nr:hypothetical protein EWM64_g3799 [Hericium alpestre]